MDLAGGEFLLGLKMVKKLDRLRCNLCSGFTLFSFRRVRSSFPEGHLGWLGILLKSFGGSPRLLTAAEGTKAQAQTNPLGGRCFCNPPPPHKQWVFPTPSRTDRRADPQGSAGPAHRHCTPGALGFGTPGGHATPTAGGDFPVWT